MNTNDSAYNTFQRIIALFLAQCLMFLPLHAYGAGVVVDGTTQTNVTNAQNGVEVVNIANPNSQGLSHNSYSQFNVSKQGVDFK